MTTLGLLPQVPPERLLVTESGILGRADVQRMRRREGRMPSWSARPSCARRGPGRRPGRAVRLSAWLKPANAPAPKPLGTPGRRGTTATGRRCCGPARESDWWCRPGSDTRPPLRRPGRGRRGGATRREVFRALAQSRPWLRKCGYWSSARTRITGPGRPSGLALSSAGGPWPSTQPGGITVKELQRRPGRCRCHRSGSLLALGAGRACCC